MCTYDRNFVAGSRSAANSVVLFGSTAATTMRELSSNIIPLRYTLALLQAEGQAPFRTTHTPRKPTDQKHDTRENTWVSVGAVDPNFSVVGTTGAGRVPNSFLLQGLLHGGVGLLEMPVEGNVDMVSQGVPVDARY